MRREFVSNVTTAIKTENRLLKIGLNIGIAVSALIALISFYLGEVSPLFVSLFGGLSLYRVLLNERKNYPNVPIELDINEDGIRITLKEIVRVGKNEFVDKVVEIHSSNLIEVVFYKSINRVLIGGRVSDSKLNKRMRTEVVLFYLTGHLKDDILSAIEKHINIDYKQP